MDSSDTKALTPTVPSSNKQETERPEADVLAPVRRVRRAILVGTIIAVVVAVVTGTATVLLFQRANAAAGHAHHLGNTALTLERLMSEVTDTETGQRGYLLMLDAQYLEPYNASRATVVGTMQELQDMLTQEPERPEVGKIQLAVGAKLAELAETIDLARAGKTQEAEAVMRSGRGKQIMDDLRRMSTEVIASLITRRRASVEEFRTDARIATAAGIIGTAALLICLLAFGGLMSRELRQRERAEAEAIRQQRHRLAIERKARSEAERTVRMQGEFVATLSHELRTPLNSILGWAQLLKKPEYAGTELEQGLETIERNARTQAQMIEDLLDTSRIAEGKVRLDVQRISPAKVVETVMQAVHPTAEAKGVRLETTLDPRTNLINGDPGRLQQVVWNIVSNAVKFTPKGGKVQVSVRRVNSSVVIEVSDTGRGINPEFLPHVFERFRQADSTTTRRFGGLGLGLAIAKQLVELHGGTISATSAGEGQGSTFAVQLPLLILHGAQSSPRDQQPVTPRAVPLRDMNVRLDGARVLIVDDERDSRDVLEAVLKRAGAQTRTAGNAAEAIESLKRFRPDVLVSDIGMPEIDGFELLRMVRALPEQDGGRTPAIALTALARSQDRTQALVAGFQVHAAKPIEPSEIIAQVAGLLRMGGKTVAPHTPAGEVSQA